MRGKAHRPPFCSPRAGITPAHAGKSMQVARMGGLCWDHPRPCGEKTSKNHRPPLTLGSPPPMRGKGVGDVHRVPDARITPAHAGKSHLQSIHIYYHTGSPPPMRGKACQQPNVFISDGITPAHAGKRHKTRSAIVWPEDHPRPCGEKVEWLKSGEGDIGSPPPMRGKAHCADNNARKHRITPAHAGKRLIFARFVAISRDHPRPCGEKLTLEGQRLTYIGSPPPMRGKEPGGAGSRRLRGITPAHAGKRAASVVQTYLLQDHPRPCGEKADNQSRLEGRAGSPPPMRGKEPPRRRWASSRRITPAHAGKSHPSR